MREHRAVPVSDGTPVPEAHVEVVDVIGDVDVGPGADDTPEGAEQGAEEPDVGTEPPAPAKGNYISEWFGHRVYPAVRITAESRADQKAGRCPFLTNVKGSDTECIKPENAKGVCTVNSASNKQNGIPVRQDWLVCEYRAFDPGLLRTVAARLYGEPDPARLALYGAVTTSRPEVQDEIRRLLTSGEGRVLVYFDEKVGGEIKISASEDSPSLSFDVTLVELLDVPGSRAPDLGRYAVLELQTMDYHGTYAHAVDLMLHARDKGFKKDFPEQFAARPDWLAEGISTPNIANVFKRTIHQMLFKFPLGTADACAGTALAVPRAVWDSWQRFLARPPLVDVGDGTFRLEGPESPVDVGAAPIVAAKAGTSTERGAPKVPAWIVVFDFDAGADVTPSPVRVTHVIATSASALAHYAYVAAPREIVRVLDQRQGVPEALRIRLGAFWPALLPLVAPKLPRLRQRRQPKTPNAGDGSLTSAPRQA